MLHTGFRHAGPQRGWLQAGRVLLSPPGTLFRSYSLSQVQRQLLKTLSMQTVRSHKTQMAVGAISTAERGTQRNGFWRQDASLVVKEYYGAQGPQGIFFFFFLNSWSILKLVVPNIIS